MKKFKIHLDPGHYGSSYNQSPVNKNYKESEFAWIFTNYLKSELELRQMIVTLSRKTQEANPSLYDRGYGAKGSDLFLSLHSNAAGAESVDYPLAVCMLDDKKYQFDEVSRELGGRLATIIAQTMGTKQCGKVMTKVSDSDRDRNGIKDDEYYGVLHGAKMAGVPGIILEHSFHTNKKAANWLTVSENLRKLAKAEAEVIVNYLNEKYGNTCNNSEQTVNTSIVETNKKVIYRVRKSWEDTKSQLGAFASLENAKKICSNGYKVYNEKGQVVYPIDSNKNEKKTNEEIAKEVIQGKWSSGNQRKTRLTNAGYDYNAIQKIVNQLLK